MSFALLAIAGIALDKVSNEALYALATLMIVLLLRQFYVDFLCSTVLRKDGIEITHPFGTRIIEYDDITHTNIWQRTSITPVLCNISEEIRIRTPHKKIVLRTGGKADIILAHIKAAKDQ